MQRVFVLLLAELVFVPSVLSEDRTAKPSVDFVRDVQPVLAERCLSCHGPEKQESSFRVDLRDSMQKGGDSGTPAIVPGKTKQSVLLDRISDPDPESRMPPEGKALTEAEIAKLKAWIDSGAEMPERFELTKRTTSDHWSFQPVAQVKLPAIENDWIQNPIDAFVLNRLTKAGLAPASEADRRTLIRRVTFNLTGLPPTPEEISEFLGDPSPDAYEKLIERLLASPAYGERWGRHWLDVVRYADSNGLDENAAHGNAFRYRDYVVSSFNADKPYLQFVQEQIAGDLLPADDLATRNEQLIATGFLSLGPKVLAEVDKTKMEMDIIDEQIDTLGKALLGLTFGCARCHDHKFDPVTTEDYYALAGIFKSTRTMETFKTIAKWQEHEVGTADEKRRKESHAKTVKAKSEEIEEFIKSANAALLASMEEGSKLPEKPEQHYPDETKAQLKKLREELASLEKSAPVMPTAMGVSEGTATDLPVHLRGSHLSLGKVVPRRFPLVLSFSNETQISKEHSGRLELARWLTDPKHPLTARVMVNRVWRWHFGKGLVDSTDNFGELGAEPSHPELLDYLAGRFLESNGSVKDLHRLILTSSAYRQSSEARPETLKRASLADPENRWLWRANIRRIEAEAIRDSLLAVGGTLDRKMGGSVLNTENYKLIFDHTSKDNTSYDFNIRSLYLPIVRNHLYDVFQLFDYTDASTVTGSRTTSTIAPQALFMMNAPLVDESAAALASRIMAKTQSEAERIEEMYQLALGRSPSESETARSQEFLGLYRNSLSSQEPTGVDQHNHQAWAALCQVVLVSNEFVTIR